MNKLAESKTLRVWTYIMGCFVIFAILVWKAAPILNGIVQVLKIL